MKINIFQKYFFLALICLVSFVVLGFFFNNFLMRQLAPKPSEMTLQPPLFFAKLVDRLNANDKVAALKELAQMSDHFPGPKLTLISDQGAVLYPPEQKLSFEWDKIQKPTEAYQSISMNPQPPTDGEPDFRPHEGHRGPPLMGGLNFGPGPGGPPPMGFRQNHLVRLSGTPAQYLLIEHPRFNDPSKAGINGPPHDKPMIPPPLFGVISLLLSLALGIAVAVSMIYYSVNKNVKLADDVISQLQKGNLKARFQVKRKDEFGQAMLRFNLMADEIEKLVEHLRSVERARTKLLQELTHDLRTPIASLKSFLETLSLKSDRIDAATKTEMLDMSLSEVQYVERLVEDLLFLAQVNEPNYQKDRKPISIEAILQDEADQINLREKFQERQISIQTHLTTANVMVSADPYLIRRLIRNALENAASFAQHKVSIQTEASGKNLILKIKDDGPGFPSEVLKTFGERRHSRQMQSGAQHRISVGLGSVIMKTICDAHMAGLQVKNQTDATGKISGAEIEMIFPI